MKTKIILTILSVAVFLAITLISRALFYFPKENLKIKAEPESFAAGMLASDEKAIAEYQTITDYPNRYSDKKWHVETR